MSTDINKELLKQKLSSDNIQELIQLYTRIEKIKSSGIILNAYSSNIDEEDDEILNDLYEFFCEHFEELNTEWISSYIQIFSWQFQSYHEGVLTYYTNFYGNSDYDTIRKTADYLILSNYDDISKYYSLGSHNYNSYKNENYPDEWIAETKKVDDWIRSNEEIIFNCLLDLCLSHKDEFLNYL